jgi:hypothetical protein
VILDLGRRYVVVSTGTGAPVRAAPDPSATQIGTLSYGSVALTTGETVGADSRTWRRIEDRGWAPREGLLVFGGVREAVELSIELRVLAAPELKAVAGLGPPLPSATAGARPGAAGTKPAAAATRPAGATGTARPGPTGTPTPRPSPSATPTFRPTPTFAGSPGPKPTTRVLYAVVLREAALRDLPAGQVLSRPPLPIGVAATVVDEAVGVDGQRYSRLEENVWLPSDAIATFASLTDASEAAYRATMGAIGGSAAVDPRAAPGLWVLRREPEFRYLADAVAAHRIAVRVGPLEGDRLAGYSFADRAILLPERVVEADARALAATLAHELTHAWEHSQGLVLPAGAGCFEAELRAFRNQAAVWERLQGPKGKEKPADELEAEHNEVQRLLRDDLEGLKARLVSRYGDQCGYHGPRPTIVARPTAAATAAPGAPPGPAPPPVPAPAKPAAKPPAKPPGSP